MVFFLFNGNIHNILHPQYLGSVWNVMKQAWEIVHWPNGKRVELCQTQMVAERLLPYHGKNHIIREIWFYDDGKQYNTTTNTNRK